jgi:hypothetical protein
VQTAAISISAITTTNAGSKTVKARISTASTTPLLLLLLLKLLLTLNDDTAITTNATTAGMTH